MSKVGPVRGTSIGRKVCKKEDCISPNTVVAHSAVGGSETTLALWTGSEEGGLTDRCGERGFDRVGPPVFRHGVLFMANSVPTLCALVQVMGIAG